MEGTIVNFKMSRHTQKGNHMVVLPKGVSTRAKAAELVGKTVTWISPAKREIKGKVASAHGNSGAVRVVFETGMPGQSIANKVKIE